MKTWLVEIRTKAWIPADNLVLGYVEVQLNNWADEYTARHVGFDEYALRVMYDPNIRKHVMDVCKIQDYLDPKSYTNYFSAADAVCLE